MEYAPGDTLRTVLCHYKHQKTQVPEHLVIAVFSQMVSLLRYLKSVRIIYCDVKPENIIMDRQDNIKLIDFGTAQSATTKLKKAFSFGGTLAYMSPEMLSDGGYSFPTDVWSLGAVIYEMMAGTLPFGSKPDKEVVRKIQNVEAAEINAEYSPGLKQAVKQMLRKKVGARITIENLAKLDFLPAVSSDLTPRQLNDWGIKHKFGFGVKQNPNEAVRFFKMSADAGSPTGMFNYCFAVLNSDKRSEALNYLKKSADLGDPDALYNYALSLEEGWGGDRNLAEAMRYYKLSADGGNTESMCNYAVACTEGWIGEPNLKEAVEYYRLAAQGGNTFGMFNFANALASGLAGPVDKMEAMKWYKLAADGGEPRAMFNYGACLSHAWAGKRDLPAAMKYFKMAADRGDVSGVLNYGMALEHGYSGSADPREALKYYKTAADAGLPEGCEAYGRLSESVALRGPRAEPK
jgi:TPR repeat protein